MFVVTVDFEVHPLRLADFMPLMIENARTSRDEEPGCRQFDVCTDAANPGAIFLYEVYDDRAAFDAHLESEHFKRFDAAVADMVTSRTLRMLERTDG